ncbi:unnamed protein product [Microthlaspi erraticum]|uniref:TIR domain-containing protein n=1 Tax=Microthlaspi erraticum TaxID=1685480 RepID=A0A6D2KWR3_9BRAS|nr:unnamed protein product [Microthlaspi erraticum]
MSSSPSTDRVFKYDVFLSFRGADTRKTVASHLYEALVKRGIRTFRDDRRIEKGESIREKLRGSIESSRFAIVIISKTYATTKWCLEELQLIMDLVSKREMGLIPVFYDVIPSDVRNLRHKFSLTEGEISEKAPEDILIWKKALMLIGDRQGIESSQCKNDAMMVGEIAGRISSRLNPMFPMDVEDMDGMEDYVERFKPLLDLDSESNEVRMIGIWGMGGIGKTSIAKYLYERHKHLFSTHHFFIEVVSSERNGIVELQEQLLSSVIDKEDDLKFWSPSKGATLIKSRLSNLKVFIVLDDVYHEDHLRFLAEKRSWFGHGSRIIITTQNKSLLKRYTKLYEVKCLDDDKALQLFQRFAFRGGKPLSRLHKHLSIQFCKLAQGLPLALQTFGNNLRNKSLRKWQDDLKSLEETPGEKIMKLLKIRYDRLEELEKTAFLHVACLFNGDPFLRVTKLLEQGDDVIQKLATKSLIDISSGGRISMHRLLEQTGRQIVRQDDPADQRILWHHEDIYQVLIDKAGTRKIQGVAYDVSKITDDDDLHIHIKWDVFKRMHNLSFLIYKQSRYLESRREDLIINKSLPVPRKLKLLHWDAYPYTTLPTGIRPEFLVELTLCYSKLITLWSKTEIPKLFKKLRKLDLTGSKDLEELPDLEEAEFLEELILEGCTSLKQIPKSICNLPSLHKLDVSNCDGLKKPSINITNSNSTVIRGRSLPVRSVRLQLHGTEPSAEESQHISLTNLSVKGNLEIKLISPGGYAEHLSYISHEELMTKLDFESPPYGCKSLDIMRFHGSKNPFKCKSFSGFPWLLELNLINLNIQKIPDDIHQMQALEKLDLSGNIFEMLPTTMSQLTKLKNLTLCNCRSLKELPELSQVERLTLSDCTKLRALIKIGGKRRYSLLELWLDNCKSIVSLSEELSHLTELRYLDLSRQDFKTLPTNITNLTSLVKLCLSYCNNLESLSGLPPSLRNLNAHGCKSLEASSLVVTHSFDLSHCPYWRQDSSKITRFPTGRRGKEVPVCACASFKGNTIASTAKQVITCSTSLISNHLQRLKSWLRVFARCVSVAGFVVLLVALAILLVGLVIWLVREIDSFYCQKSMRCYAN